MSELKLPKLPDRTPVKFTITVDPGLAQALREYAAEYERQYGLQENIADLVPFMLAAFIESDAGFKKARRDRHTSVADAGRDRNAVVRGRMSVEPSPMPGQPSS